jgi:hypothetical protein
MKTLDAQARLEYGRAAIAVLRALRLKNVTMRYNEFARAIGLITEDETWEPWHRNQTADILNLVAAVERQAGENTGGEPLEFHRIVRQDGTPGEGFYRTSRIVTTEMEDYQIKSDGRGTLGVSAQTERAQKRAPGPPLTSDLTVSDMRWPTSKAAGNFNLKLVPNDNIG